MTGVGWGTTEVKHPSQYIVTMAHAINPTYHCDVDLYHLAVVSVRNLLCKAFLSPLLVLSPLEVSHYVQLTPKGQESRSPSSKAEHLHELFGIPLMGELSLLLHLFIQSFIYISVDVWIFQSLDYNPVLLYRFCCSQLWPLGSC